MPKTAALVLATLLATLSVGACVTSRPVSDVVMLEPRDGPLRLRPSEISRYQCSIGLLVCTSETGRVSMRRCLCVE
jgi:hypothetical protein